MFGTRGTKIAAIGVGLLMTASAWADCRRKISLIPSSVGIATDSSGAAEVRAQGSQQRFKLSMDARVADGTLYVVRANGMAVGTITVTLGDGELDLNNNNGKVLPAGLNPVCSVGQLSVTDAAGNSVLSGSF